MKRGTGVIDIHTWWEGLSEERYWLDVTDREGREQLLASPRGEDKGYDSWAHRLITHVRGGDIVFHYDATRQAIVAMSLPHGRVEKKQLWWPHASDNPGDAATRVQLPSWGIALRQASELGAIVPMDEIAHTQWNLFPTLRKLEDEVGDPLYYPFEMGNRTATRPLSGFIFKLPALLVSAVPELSRAAARVTRQVAPYEGVLTSPTAVADRQYAASR